MESVVLVVHLIIALSLIGVVLMQRSEGGGLGMGGGGGGVMSARGAATALGKVTWGLAIAFIISSLALTIIARQQLGSSSTLDSLPAAEQSEDGTALPGLGSDLLPPVLPSDAANDAASAEETDPDLPPAPASN